MSDWVLNAPLVFAFEILTNCIYESEVTGYFRDSLKETNIFRFLPKNAPLSKYNYRFVDAVRPISQICKLFICNQRYESVPVFRMLKYQMVNICYELFERDIDRREATLKMIFFLGKNIFIF